METAVQVLWKLLLCHSVIENESCYQQDQINTYWLTPWSRVLLDKSTGSKLVKKFPAFYGTRRFISSFASARYLSQSRSNSIQTISPHSTSWRSIITLTSRLSLGLPIGLFPSGFSTKTLYTLLLPPIDATCPAHLIPLDVVTRKILGKEHRTLSSSLCSFLHYLFTSSLLGMNTK